MSAKMDEIKPGLYLGSVEAALDVTLLEKNKIGSVLTISDISLEDSVRLSEDLALLSWFGFSSNNNCSKHPKTMYIQADDSNNQDLITNFDDACTFISENLKSGSENDSVLVHCWAGRSRSVTIVAAYLMKTYKIGVAEALEIISAARPILSPMRGFIEQLHLYARFGCRFDDVNPECKRWYCEKLEDWLSQSQKDSAIEDKQISQVVRAFVISDEDSAKNPETATYRCCRCGHYLFSNTDIIQHERGAGAVTFIDTSGPDEARRKGHKGSFNQRVHTPCRDSIFVDPLPWMEKVILEVDGKLHCPNNKCSSKIGSFTWIGERCRCGRWVVPAFHMLPDRVEQRGRIALLPTRHREHVISKMTSASQ